MITCHITVMQAFIYLKILICDLNRSLLLLLLLLLNVAKEKKQIHFPRPELVFLVINTQSAN